MISLLYLTVGQKCVSNIYTAKTLGFPISNNVTTNLIMPERRFNNLMENICVCSNERSVNGIKSTNTQTNGICEDISNSSHSSLYDFGTDCDDCGPRGNYPSYFCNQCNTYTMFEQIVEHNIPLEDGPVCMTPRGNILSNSFYSSHFLSDKQLFMLENETETCLLYVIQNNEKVPFSLQSSLTINLYSSTKSFTIPQEKIVTDSINITGSFLTNPEILVSIHNLTQLTITVEIQVYSKFLGVNSKRIIPNLNFEFKDDYITTDLQEIGGSFVTKSFLPYQRLKCNSDHSFLNQDCTINPSSPKIYSQNNFKIEPVPFLMHIKPPMFDTFVPAIKLLQQPADGFIDMHISVIDNQQPLNNNRILVEFFINAVDMSIVEMYGLVVYFENMIPSRYCHNTLNSYFGDALYRKRDVGSENHCIWIKDNKITSMRVTDNMLSVIYSKLPVAYVMHGEETDLIYLFAIEVNSDRAQNSSIIIDKDSSTFILKQFGNKPSSICNLQKEITQQSKYLTACSPNKMGMTQDIIYQNPKTILYSTSTQTSTQENRYFNDTRCLDENTTYIMNEYFQLGTIQYNNFIALGPETNHLNCNMLPLYNLNNITYNYVYDVCTLNNLIIRNNQNQLYNVSCCSCHQTSTSIFLPPSPPRYESSPFYPPLPPQHPPSNPSPYYTYNNLQSSVIQISTTQRILFSINCTYQGIQSLLIINATVNNNYIGSPCVENGEAFQNCTEPSAGSICKVAMTTDSTYLRNALFYSNFNPTNFICGLSGSVQSQFCEFTSTSIRQAEFLPSPSPPPIRLNMQWIYSSVEHCSLLLESQTIDYYITRTKPKPKVITNSIVSLNTEDRFYKTCSMFTNHLPNVKILNTTVKTYNFERGFQFAPIANWTFSFITNNISFEAYLDDTVLYYPGNNTNLIDYTPFLMKSLEEKTMNILVPSV